MRQVDFDIEQWPTTDGSIDMIFGGLGSGKTYAATADILEDLSRGRLVYATWPIDFSEYDERQHGFKLFLAIVGIRQKFYRFPKENFQYVPLTDPDFMEKFATSINATWYIDEAYAVIDSYVKNKMSLEQRFSIYGTRHFDRRLVIIAQRPSSIHVAARAMVNRFYMCERPLAFVQKILHIALFTKTEFQDMIDENVDLTKPLSTRYYFGRKRIFKTYNSKYLRGLATPPRTPKIVLYQTNPLSVWSYLKTRIKQRGDALATPRAKPIRRASSKLPPLSSP